MEFNKEVGFVISAKDYLLYLNGLPGVRVNEVVVTSGGGRALVSALSGDRVEALMLDSERPKPEALFYQSESGLQIPIGPFLFGRTINPLGQPVDGRGALPKKGVRVKLDVIAAGVSSRDLVMEQLKTGLTLIDTLLPIGKGQRQLIFGEPRSGKTAFLLDTIINQKGRGIICIYAALGKQEIETKRFSQAIAENGAADYTMMISAPARQSAPLIAITPSVAFAVAEFFRLKGREVLLVLDDLGTHARYLREIALLSGRVPGRESYPGDIFYQHAHQMERAGNFNKEAGNGSITLLPVIETEIENMTNLIPTNLMSSTDGHLLFSAKLRAQGYYPSLDFNQSVTRVGKQTQLLLHKQVAGKIRALLSEYEELQRFGQFGAELTPKTRETLKLGAIALELLKQEPLQKLNRAAQICLLSLVFTPFFLEKDLEFVRTNKNKLITAFTVGSQFEDLREMAGRAELVEFMEILRKKLPAVEKITQK